MAHGERAATGDSEAITQHIHRAAFGLAFQLFDQPVQHHIPGAVAIHGANSGHGLGLGFLQPAQDIFWEQCPRRVIISGLAHPPAGGSKLLDDVAFEFAFVVDVAHGHSFRLLGHYLSAMRRWPELTKQPLMPNELRLSAA